MPRIHSWLTLAIALTMACDSATTPTESVPAFSVLKTVYDTTITVFEPNCAGEMLELHLRQQVVTRVSVDAAGGLHTHFVINDRGTTALGLTSGTTYHQTGAATETQNNSGDFAPLTITRTDFLFLVSEGAGPNLLVQQLFHVTLDANGGVPVFMDVTAVVCQ